jgi:hypothetical protein
MHMDGDGDVLQPGAHLNARAKAEDSSETAAQDGAAATMRTSALVRAGTTKARRAQVPAVMGLPSPTWQNLDIRRSGSDGYAKSAG